MASIINASTTAGIVQTGDTSATLQLQSNGTTIATISSTGLTMNSGNIVVASTAAPAFWVTTTSSVQSVSNNTDTKLIFNVKQFDTNSNFDAVTNYRFTPTVAGYYQFNCYYSWQNVMNGYCALKLYKNGSSLQTLDFRSATGGSNQYLANAGSIVVYANGSTDYFEMYCYQVTGSSQNTNGSGYQWSGALIRSA